MCFSYCSHCHDQMPDKKQDRKNALGRITPKWQVSDLLFCCHKKNSLKENTSGEKALIWLIVHDWGKSVRQELETIGYITSTVKSRVKQIFSGCLIAWLCLHPDSSLYSFTIEGPAWGRFHPQWARPSYSN